MAERPDAVLIAGPTASGKSALAVEAALTFDGVVVNADSMQVYAGLPILTAQPLPDEMAGVEHRLYGHVGPGQAWSVADWLRQARSVLAEVREKGKCAVFVGGTGLYFAALENGLSPVPAIPEAVRRAWRERALADPGALHGELAARDAEAAGALASSDVQRLTRALEVFEATGESILAWQRRGRAGAALAGLKVEKRVVEIDRQHLHERIGRRFDAMMATGALDEVRALLALGLPAAQPAMKAIGVPQLAAHLRGEMSLSEAVERAKAATRQYAKRQDTWFRHQTGSDWRRAS